MDQNMIADIVCGAVLLAGLAIGAKRGLFKSLTGLLVIVAAMIGSAILADLLTEPIADLICPRIEEKMVGEFLDEHGEELDEADEKKNTLTDAIRALGLPEETLEKLLRPAQETVGSIRDRVTEAYRDAISKSVREIVTQTVHAAVTLVSFVVLLVVLRLAARVLDHVFDLPVLETVNDFGGGILGFLEAAAILFVACRVLPGLDAERFGAFASETKLFAFFANHTPLSLLNILSD